MSVIVGTAEGYILPRVRLADNDVVSTIVEVTEGYILLRMCLVDTLQLVGSTQCDSDDIWIHEYKYCNSVEARNINCV